MDMFSFFVADKCQNNNRFCVANKSIMRGFAWQRISHTYLYTNSLLTLPLDDR